MFKFIVIALLILGMVVVAVMYSTRKADTVATDTVTKTPTGMVVAKEGDTYASIATEYGVSEEELREYNLNRDVVAGAVIEIPSGQAAHPPTVQPQTPIAATPTPTPWGPGAGAGAEVQRDCQSTHGIVPGPNPQPGVSGFTVQVTTPMGVDQLSKIYGVAIVDIIENNFIDNVDCISSGSLIFIPNGETYPIKGAQTG